MDCPKCKDVKLRRNGYGSPDSCQKCGGMWLEFAKIPGFFEQISFEEPKEFSVNVNDGKTGFCPSGHGLMTRAKVEDNESPFYLEKCSSCGGVWFDKDEWQRIIENNLVECLSDIWCSSWQTQQRKEKSRNSYLKTNKNIFGEEVFEKILELAELLKGHHEKGRAIALLQEEIKE